MSKEQEQKMGFIRRNFFPVKNNEMEKFLWLSSLIGFIGFSYAVLRAMKDNYIIPLGGSEPISALKLFCVLPSAYLAKYVFDYVSQRSSLRDRFNYVIGYFLVFLIVFTVSLPWHDLVKPVRLSLFLKERIPRLAHIWIILREWQSSIFYIQAELFGVFVMSVLFYSLANRVTTLKQAGYFYSLFGISANIGTSIAGRLIRGKLIGEIDDSKLLFFVSIALILLIILNTLFCRAMDKNPEKFDVQKKSKKKKPILSFTESLTLLKKNNYLGLIAALVLIYGLSINLFEAIYKNWLFTLSKEAAPGIIEEYASMGKLLTLKEAGKIFIKKYNGLQMEVVGNLSIFTVLFIATPARRLGWRILGLVPPFIFLCSTTVFAYCLFFQERLGFIAEFLSLNSKEVVLLIGLMGVVSIKAIKYTFFDPHKEKAYIPLDPQTKLLGKSGIEPFSRLGKASGSVIVNIAGVFGGVSMFRGTFFLILIATVTLWILIVEGMYKGFKKLVKEKEEREKREKKEKKSN